MIEYQKVTRYPISSKNNCKYISNVFNTTDLMCLIFQFAYHTFNDCQNTSLVCSYWMYYSFDTKSHILQYNSKNAQYNADDVNNDNPQLQPQSRIQRQIKHH